MAPPTNPKVRQPAAQQGAQKQPWLLLISIWVVALLAAANLGLSIFHITTESPFWHLAISVGGFGTVGAAVLWSLYKRVLDPAWLGKMKAHHTFWMLIVFMLLVAIVVGLIVVIWDKNEYGKRLEAEKTLSDTKALLVTQTQDAKEAIKQREELKAKYEPSLEPPPKTLTTRSYTKSEFLTLFSSAPITGHEADVQGTIERTAFLRHIINYYDESKADQIVMIYEVTGFTGNVRPFTATMKIVEPKNEFRASIFRIKPSTNSYSPIVPNFTEPLGRLNLTFSVPQMANDDKLLIITCMPEDSYKKREVDSFQVVPQDVQ